MAPKSSNGNSIKNTDKADVDLEFIHARDDDIDRTWVDKERFPTRTEMMPLN